VAIADFTALESYSLRFALWNSRPRVHKGRVVAVDAWLAVFILRQWLQFLKAQHHQHCN
jgi:hypothetical protein